MKECYISPQLQITCFAPREHLATLLSKDSVDVMNAMTYAAGSQADPEEGDIFFPIVPQP